MPRGKSKSGRGAKADPNQGRRYFCAPDAEWGGYVNLRVSEDERADFDGWQSEDAAHLPQYLETALVEGLKLSLSYDATNSAYTATFTGAGCLGDAARYCLTARAADPIEATNLLLYKHLMLLDGDWSSFSPATGRATFG